LDVGKLPVALRAEETVIVDPDDQARRRSRRFDREMIVNVRRHDDVRSPFGDQTLDRSRGFRTRRFVVGPPREFVRRNTERVRIRDAPRRNRQIDVPPSEFGEHACQIRFGPADPIDHIAKHE
jgi:hypothetical protein